MALRTPKKRKKVSFMMDATGFNFSPSKERPHLQNDHSGSDSHHWRAFGSLSKSEFSFMSDRSSFAASLNTLSDDSMWLADPEHRILETEQKLDFSKEENNNVQGFTFGNSAKTKTNHIQNKPRTISVTSPSFSSKHSKSAHSITFSSTISLYTDTEKKQNSLLFYDLWGVPATEERSRGSRADSTSESEDNHQYTHHTNTSTSLSGLIASGDIGRKQSTTITIMSDAIDEEDEWSECENEWSDSDMPLTQLISTKKRSHSVTTHKFRKRKSTLTDNFIFGGMSSSTLNK